MELRGIQRLDEVPHSLAFAGQREVNKGRRAQSNTLEEIRPDDADPGLAAGVGARRGVALDRLGQRGRLERGAVE